MLYMKLKSFKMKRIILKINVNGSVEPFTSLPKLFEVYPELDKQKENITTYLSRKKEKFDGDGFILTRQIVNVSEVVFS